MKAFCLKGVSRALFAGGAAAAAASSVQPVHFSEFDSRVQIFFR